MKQIKCVNLLTVIVVISGLLVGCGNENKNITSKVNENSYTQTKTNESTNYEKCFVFNEDSILLLMDDYSDMKKIVIPERCKRIEAMVFHGNENIEEVSFQSNKNVGGEEWEFWGCKNLKKAKLPDEQIKINDYMFCECEKLSSFIMPKATEIIGEYAFSECNSLKEIEIGESVKTIGKWGLITGKNKLVIDYAFDDADYFNENRVCFVKGNNPYDELGYSWVILKLKI